MITRRSLLSLFPPIFLPWLFGSAAQVAPTVQQWEYLIEMVSPTARGALPTVLAKRGIEGWELCARVDREGLAELIFKRVKG